MRRLYAIALLVSLAGCATTPDPSGDGAGPSELPAQVRTGQAEVDDYFHRLRRTIKRNMEYPAGSRMRHEEGDVVIAIAVARDGTILSKEIRESSGFPGLDQEALAMVQRSSPLPAVPKQISGDRIRIVLPFRFTLFHNTAAIREKEKTYAKDFGDDVAGAFQCGHRAHAERYLKAVKLYLEECSDATDAEIAEIMAIYDSAEPAACSQVRLSVLDAMAMTSTAFVKTGC
jgi:TonB family protein